MSIAQEKARGQDEYIALSRQLPTLPPILLDRSSQPNQLRAVNGASLELKNGSIVDESGQKTALPANTRFQAFEDIPGAYLVEHISDGAPVYRLGNLVSRKLVLGEIILNRVGPLITLPRGRVGMLRSNRQGPSILILNVAQISSGSLKPTQNLKQQPLPSRELYRLGNVIHPKTSEVGLAFLTLGSNKDVLVFYEKKGPVRLTLQEEIQAFAAGNSTLVLGLIPSDCDAGPGLPRGLCTPVLFRSDVPTQDGSIDRLELSRLSRLTSSRPGWTFGANERTSGRQDIKIIGDRAYVIMYQGMTQSLGYFSLSQPGKGKTVIPPKEAVDLNFMQASLSDEVHSLILRQRHATEPTSFLVVGDDGQVDQAFQAADQPAKRALDLAAKTIRGSEENLVGPMVLVAKRANLENEYCKGGRALLEIYGGYRRPVRPKNPLGLVPELLSSDGVYVQEAIPGSGSFGLGWAELGAFQNASNQTISVRNTVQFLRESGCDKVTVTGFSHGGVVALNALLSHPDVVKNIFIGGAPLDLESEYRNGLRNVASFLPKGAAHFSSNGDAEALSAAAFADVSPKELAKRADDLSGTRVFILVGDQDTLAKSYADESAISEMRQKGATVEIVQRKGVGHTSYGSIAQWVEYHWLLGKAIAASE
ncbi:MAG: alpha/beta fold hydrolase [Pseudomonadota bacterium]